MKKNQFFATTLLLTIALFCTCTLSAQWSESATAIYPTVLTKNVGIGTSTPNAELQVNGAAYINTDVVVRKFLYVGDDATNNGTFDIRFGSNNQGTGEGIGSKRTEGGNWWGLDFYTANINRLSITNAGNVGIGTSSPIAKLQIGQGNLHVDSGYGIEFGDQNSTYPPHSKIWENSSTGHLIIRPGGTQSFPEGPGPFPGYLELQGDVFVNKPYSDATSLFLGNPSSGESIKSRRVSYGSNQYGLDFYTANQNRFSITNAGNIGIGISNPTNAKLQFSNELGNKITLYDNGNNVAYGFGINGGNLCAYIPSTTGHKFSIRVNNHNGAEKFVVNSLGYVGIGNSSPLVHLDVSGVVRCQVLLQTSDRRYKTNIKTLDGAMDKVLAMRGTSYDFAADFLPQNFTAGKQVGFIAQEMKTIMPELVKEDANGMLAINYTGVIPVLVEALKEQHEVIEEKENRIAALEAQNNELQSRLTRIEAALGITTGRQSSNGKTESVSAKVSPNPTSGLVTIDLLNASSAKTIVVNIIDASGRKVVTQTVASGEFNIQFDLSQLPAGVYVAQVMANGKMVSSNKVQLVK